MGLTGLVLYPYFRFRMLRDWIDGLDARVLLQIHLSRFVGILLLLLWHRGELPYAFAVPAGFGDIIVALAAVVLVAVPLDQSRFRRYLTIWNVVGFLDLVFVVFTAASIILVDPLQLRTLTHLPLCLLPTFLVPLLLATHVMIFARLLRK